MFAKDGLAQKFFWRVTLLALAMLIGLAPLARAQKKPSAKSAPAAGAAQTPEKSSPARGDEQDESQVLDKAFDTSLGNPQVLIKNLEDFLARFPSSPQREQVLRTILKQALQSNEPAKAQASAEKLLELNPDDPQLVAAFVDLLERQSDAASRQKAIHYLTRLIERAEAAAKEPAPSDAPAERWNERQMLMKAAGYLMRGKVYAKSGETEKAFADCEKSFAAFPTAEVAERLGDLAAKRGDTARAIDYYATAFAFPDRNLDPADRDQVRVKLGSLYVAQHQSEKGLGDLILARYDELLRTLKSRLAGGGSPNADVRDPFDFVLRRLDGTELRLADFRGKVVVVDFWATWCAPCRLEGKLFEQVRQNFQHEAGAVFLAANLDRDRSGVPDYIKEEKWTVPVVYAQGLDQLLGVNALPTVMIFDREGRVVFRQAGLDPSGFSETLTKKIREALEQPARASASR